MSLLGSLKTAFSYVGFGVFSAHAASPLPPAPPVPLHPRAVALEPRHHSNINEVVKEPAFGKSFGQSENPNIVYKPLLEKPPVAKELPDADDIKPSQPRLKLEELTKNLESPDRDVRFCAVLGFANFVHDYPAFCEDAVAALVEKLSSLSSDGPETAAHALSYLSTTSGRALTFISEAVLGLSVFGDETQKIEIGRYFDPEIRRHLACAISSVAIEDRKVAGLVLDDLISCFSIPEAELHQHVASELYQIADAHGGDIANRVYRALKNQYLVEFFELPQTEIAQHIQGLEKRFPYIKETGIAPPELA
jgi:hypothetical protein